jgi:hypothetical protein
MVMANDLENRFGAAMMELYQRARSEANYNATKYLQMLTEHGGLGTARILLLAPTVFEGFSALRELNRLDLTVEALINDHPEYHPLFTDVERETARRRLADYQYPPAIDPLERFVGAFSGDVSDWTSQPDKYLGQALWDELSPKSGPRG